MEIGARVESTGLEIPRHSSLHFIHIRPDLRHHFFSAVSCASAHNSNNSIIPPKAQRGALAHPAPRPGRAGAGTARVCTSGASGPTAPSPVFTLLHGSPGCVWLLRWGSAPSLPLAAGPRTVRRKRGWGSRGEGGGGQPLAPASFFFHQTLTHPGSLESVSAPTNRFSLPAARASSGRFPPSAWLTCRREAGGRCSTGCGGKPHARAEARPGSWGLCLQAPETLPPPSHALCHLLLPGSQPAKRPRCAAYRAARRGLRCPPRPPRCCWAPPPDASSSGDSGHLPGTFLLVLALAFWKGEVPPEHSCCHSWRCRPSHPVPWPS